MTKLTLPQVRETLPPEVSDFVVGLSKQYKTRSISFDHYTTLYIAEDGQYTAFHNGDSSTVNAGGEWNGLGACNVTIPLPIGVYVVCKQWFMGKVFITVYHNNGQGRIA